MDKMLKINWPKELDKIRRTAHPAHEMIFKGFDLDYYWSAFQTEWATDVMFASRSELQAIYPALVRGAIEGFDCRVVMRFLGRKQLNRFPVGEVMSDYGDRYEGIRIKHVSQKNSVKAYEFTIYGVSDTKVKLTLRSHHFTFDTILIIIEDSLDKSVKKVFLPVSTNSKILLFNRYRNDVCEVGDDCRIGKSYLEFS